MESNRMEEWKSNGTKQTKRELKFSHCPWHRDAMKEEGTEQSRKKSNMKQNANGREKREVDSMFGGWWMM